MKSTLSAVLAAVLVCLGATSFAQAPAGSAAATDLAELRAALDDTMARWAEHREQTIEVREIKALEGGEDTSDSRASLELRYKTLMTKRWSNREWRDYWMGEAKLAAEVAGIYERLVASDGSGPQAAEVEALHGRRAEATTAVADQQAALDRLLLEVSAARLTLEGRTAADRESLPARTARVDALRAEFDAAMTAHAKQERALELLPDTAPAAQRDKATKALAAAKATLEQASAGLATAESEKESVQRSVLFIEALLAGQKPDELALTDPALATPVATLLGAPEKLAAARASLADAQARVAQLNAELDHAQSELRNIPLRVGVLAEWARLATDKQDNQDIYYEALNADLAAVKERMRDFDVEISTEHVGLSQRVCEEERSREQTPLAHYYRCVDQIDAERQELEDQLRRNHASLELARVQDASLEQLLASQRADEALVRRELDIPRRELERLADGEGGSAEWRAIWETYEERAKEKTKKLASAVISSKVTRRAVKVNIAFYETENGNIEAKIDAIKAYQEQREGRSVFYAAAFRTIWEYLKQAWLVPIYLLLAWLFLWVAKRALLKVILRARDELSDRDAIQRVETLSAVARGALKLVIFIATPLLVLDALSVDIGPILGGAAIFGLAISFGSQSLVKDVVTGFFILLENQYAVGDVVEIGGKTGTVENINLRRTVLRDMKGCVHNIANGSVGTVVNNSQGWSRVLFHVGVGYESDLDLVREVIDRVGDEMFADPELQTKLSEPPRYVGLTAFGDSALTVRAMFKTPIFENWGAEREFNYRVKRAFDEAGISIPFPQRDVHVINAEDGES